MLSRCEEKGDWIAGVYPVDDRRRAVSPTHFSESPGLRLARPPASPYRCMAELLPVVPL
jgi:hypothetical protein